MDSMSGTRSEEQGGRQTGVVKCGGGRKCGEANQRAERAPACVCSWHGAGGRGDADFMHH